MVVKTTRSRALATAVLAVLALGGCDLDMGAELPPPDPSAGGQQPAEGAPQTGSSAAIFDALCPFSHRASDDPIVHPGQPGASHSHDFFGNTTTSATTTGESLRAGETTCTPGGDRSAYWVPTLYRDGQPVDAVDVNIYYQDFLREGEVQAFPPDLRVRAGDPTGMDTADLRARWECTGAAASASIPSGCTDDVTLRISFPDCWNGVDLDGPDHRSHLAYSAFALESFALACPASHPVQVPGLQINIRYPIRDGNGVTLASGDPVTAHGDFFNGWRPGEQERLVIDCLRSNRACLADILSVPLPRLP